MWHSIYRTDSGKLKSHGTRLPDPLPAGLTSITHADRQDQDNVWDEATRSWIPHPKPAKIPLDDFVRRFTIQERASYYQSTGTGAVAFQRALALMGAANVRADLVGAELNGLLGLLVDDGILSPQRKTEILTP